MIGMIFLMGMLFQFQLHELTEWVWFNTLYEMRGNWIILCVIPFLVALYGWLGWASISYKRGQ